MGLWAGHRFERPHEIPPEIRKRLRAMWRERSAPWIRFAFSYRSFRERPGIGITKEVWHLATTPAGDHLVAYIESPDLNKALGMFIESRDRFDMWFKERLANATGLDLNDPPEIQLPELVSSYQTT